MTTELAKRNLAVITDPEELGRRAKIWKMFEASGKELMSTVKELTIAGENTGYKIVEQKGRATITDAGKAFKLMQQYGVTFDEFSDKLSLTMAYIDKLLVDRVAKQKGVKKKEAMLEIRELLGEVIQHGKPVNKLVSAE